MAQRNNPNVDSATLALQNASISSPHDLHPALRPANSYPPPNTSPHRPLQGGLAGRRKPNLNLRDLQGASGGAAGAGLGAGRPSLAQSSALRGPLASAPFGSHFDSFSNVVDISGRLHFSGRAVLHASGVNFSNGASFSINSSELELNEELGRGNYGTVKKVIHKPTNVPMAMKEIRLELDQSRLNAIIMELEILHKASEKSEYIVEFHGAFFSESCVYYCMEYMDAGSLDKLVNYELGEVVQIVPGVNDEALTWKGVPEEVLARVATSVVKGLKFLKDELEVIHRDVKPTNVLINKKGQVKLCDFGVSGQLEKSLAKTSIGCQSYMAPERIRSESEGQAPSTYTVSSDVWSVGLSLIEIAIGRYPFPPEVYTNALAQLQAIVSDDPPELPDRYSEVARHWVARCLVKSPADRAGYAELLEHEFVKADESREVDMASWVSEALSFRDAKMRVRTVSKSMSAPPTAVD
ncbi:kinase-like protein [Dendrothele bispora CBS 962.96]|uniref:mitogen-activated protein kinase kinase n=1 Tax=Dendrothele bispora (strain CBS 962.96) TaxID=1314807 RepID=A0A4V6T5L5_DENBC|nr:kinase-like protein [Dendrothele bispora CBS 962.96]